MYLYVLPSINCKYYAFIISWVKTHLASSWTRTDHMVINYNWCFCGKDTFLAEFRKAVLTGQ